MEEITKAMEITDCELLTVLPMWETNKELSMQEIWVAVNERFGKNWAKPTVSTLIGKLRQKGYLSMQRKGRVFYHIPLVTKQEYIENTVPQLFEVLGIDRENALSLSLMTSTKNNLEKLPDSQLLVMLIIWNIEAGATDMAGKISDLQNITVAVNERYSKNWAIQTVSTYLARLREKKYLSMCRKGRDFLYTSLVTKQEYIENTVPQLFRLLGIDREMILSSNWWG